MFKKIVVGLSLAITLVTASFAGNQVEAASYHTKAIKVAKSELGTKYKMGGISSSGFDCSGLVKYSYQKLVRFYQELLLTYIKRKES